MRLILSVMFAMFVLAGAALANDNYFDWDAPGFDMVIDSDNAVYDNYVADDPGYAALGCTSYVHKAKSVVSAPKVSYHYNNSDSGWDWVYEI